MQERRINRNDDNIVKVYLNEDDFIYLNAADYTLADRVREFLDWIYSMEGDLNTKAEAAEKKYEGRPMVTEDEAGDPVIDTEQLGELITLKMDTLKEAVKRLDDLFGQGAVHMYFKEMYTINPDFVPDEECIGEFIENILPVVEEIFKTRYDRNRKKYNRARRGARK